MSTLGIIILVVLVLLVIGSLPTWGYSRDWGYGPFGFLGVLLVIAIVLWALGVFDVSVTAT